MTTCNGSQPKIPTPFTRLFGASTPSDKTAIENTSKKGGKKKERANTPRTSSGGLFSFFSKKPQKEELSTPSSVSLADPGRQPPAKRRERQRGSDAKHGKRSLSVEIIEDDDAGDHTHQRRKGSSSKRRKQSDIILDDDTRSHTHKRRKSAGTKNKHLARLAEVTSDPQSCRRSGPEGGGRERGGEGEGSSRKGSHSDGGREGRRRRRSRVHSVVSISDDMGEEEEEEKEVAKEREKRKRRRKMSRTSSVNSVCDDSDGAQEDNTGSSLGGSSVALAMTTVVLLDEVSFQWVIQITVNCDIYAAELVVREYSCCVHT